MFDIKFRPKATYPTYPPYHKDYYLEEYFCDQFIKSDKSNIHRNYLGIFWTNLYCNNDYSHQNFNIQEDLNKLDETLRYFTVVQHDLGVKEQLPKDTLIFSAGGLQKGDNVIPIPLICSLIPKDLIKEQKKEYLASFVGSMTHPIREKMYHILMNNSEYKIDCKLWNNTVQKELLTHFIDISTKSKFMLCPRGYGSTSFRLYESFQLGCVPVYISDDHYLPWTDELEWSDFCVLISENEISEIDSILKSISDDDYNKMFMKGKEVYEKYFTLNSMYTNIIKRL